MKCSYFISEADYEKYDSPDHTAGNNAYLGPEDANGDCWKCCMTEEDADKCIADHTNEDGTINYDVLNEDLGLEPGQLDENSHRIDFETEDEVQNTEQGGVNDNGQCTGDGKLPGGYSDLEAKNVPRENAVDRGEISDYGHKHDNPDEKNEALSENEGNEESAESKEPESKAEGVEQQPEGQDAQQQGESTPEQSRPQPQSEPTSEQSQPEPQGEPAPEPDNTPPQETPSTQSNDDGYDYSGYGY